MKYFLLFALCMVSLVSFSQMTEREKLQEIAQQRELEKIRQVRQQMDSGVLYLDREQYELADGKFKYALAHMKSIPSDLTFYFGKNSYFLGKNKQGVDWLTKYIQLKGTAGKFSEEAAELLKKAETALLLENKVMTEKTTELFSKDFDIDCGPAGKVMCPVCNGTTLVIRKDYLGDTYKTCPYCKQQGTLNCEDYNKLLRGQLKAVN